MLEDRGEHGMVRHEAAEALGSIATPPCVALLEAHCGDGDPIVAHSCEVALDMMRYERSGAFQYADMGADAPAAARLGGSGVASQLG